MENNTKFTVAIDKLNKKIAELNIKISKEPNNEAINQELEILLKDREELFRGNSEQLKELIEKYGSNK